MANPKGPQSPDELRAEVEIFADAFLPADEDIEPVREGKAIHDPIWGTSVFSPVEISVLDTPLMQRLRGVHQTSLAYLIYPAANHTRFEHSLGVTVVADRLCDALVADLGIGSRYEGAVKVEQGSIDRLTVRLAALLHDCGHAFLSHVGERQLENHPAIRTIQATEPKYEKAKAHEILSSLVVSSKRFQSFVARLKALYPQDSRLDHVSVDEVSEFIVGHAIPKRQFLADIINGPFDADKLDYLFRDAYFTGLRLALDIDRLLYSMTVAVVDNAWLMKPAPRNEAERRKELKDLADDCRLRLVVRASGTTALEQILFNKIQLTVNIYHHQKVRAADAMLTCFVERLKAIGGDGAGLSLDNPVDFLRHTDWEWLYKASADDEYLNRITERIKTRRLLKRALVICRATAPAGLDGLIRFQDDPAWPEVHEELRHATLAELPAGHGLEPYDIVFDLPNQPSFREAAHTPILLADRSLDTLESFFPTGSWLTTFFAAKWQAHVFCPDGVDVRRQVSTAARRALREHPDIQLELTDQCIALAHLDEA